MCVCVCVLNRDERVGVNGQVNVSSINRRGNNVYFFLLVVPMTNYRMDNAMVPAFGGCFAELVGCD